MRIITIIGLLKMFKKYCLDSYLPKRDDETRYRGSQISHLRNSEIIPLRNSKMHSESIRPHLNNRSQRFSDNKIVQKNVLSEFKDSISLQLHQIKETNQFKKQVRKHSEIQRILQKQKEEEQMTADLSAVKYRLKTLSLERQTQIERKSRLFTLKTQERLGHQFLYPPIFHTPYQSLNPPQYKPPQIDQSFYDQPSTASQTYKLEQKNSHAFMNTIEKTDKTMNNFKSKKFRRTNFKMTLNRMNRHTKVQNIRRLKKCFLAVYFTKCLKSLHLKILSERRDFFTDFWPHQFIKTQETFKQYFFQNFSPFFKLIRSKKQSYLTINEEDTKNLKVEKVNSTKQVMKVFFECLQELKKLQVLGKIAWSFCKHGSFVDYGVLTVDEVCFVCLNDRYGYLRMDKNLQKSQIISVILVKLIVFKYLLHPWKKWLREFNPSENKVLAENIKIFGSIIYHMLIEIQRNFLEKVDTKKYRLGNFNEVKKSRPDLKVECSPSLQYDSNKSSGSVINGLHSLDYIKRHSPFKSVRREHKSVLAGIVEQIHSFSCQYQKLFKDKVNLKREKAQLKY